MPEQLVNLVIPLKHKKNGRVGIVLQHFCTAVLLGDRKGFVAVDLKELDVKHLGRGVGWAICVLGAVGDIAIRPGIGLGRMLRGGSET